MGNYDLTVRSISFFQHPATTTKPSLNMSLTEVYDLVKGEKYQQITKELRSENDPEAYSCQDVINNLKLN